VTKQHYLQQLARLGFQIAKQPNGLQRLIRQSLCLVDQDHHPTPLLMQADQMAMDAIGEIQLALIPHRQPQLQRQRGA